MNNIEQEYQELDFDTEGNLQRRIWTQISTKNNSFKERTVWRICIVATTLLIAVIVWQTLPAKSSYLPNPDELNRMQFDFYRELALPGQDLGISYDDFAQIQERKL